MKQDARDGVPEATSRKEVLMAAVCRDCPWHTDGERAVVHAYGHAAQTGHAVSAEHRERWLWEWERRDRPAR